MLCNLLRQQQENLAQTAPGLTNTVLTELNKTFSDSFTNLQDNNLKQIVDFTLWNDFWNKYGIYGKNKKENRNTFSRKRYSRGRLLFIDYGHHNVGLEFSLSHIGIVLKDFGDLLEVLPVTSDKNQTYSRDIENTIIRVKKAQYNQFDDNSILLIHQIQSISKNRIIKDLFKSIKHTPLMEEIEEKIYSTYTPYLKSKMTNEFNRLNQIILAKEEEIQNKEKELEDKIKEIETLKQQLSEVYLKFDQTASSSEN